jgi:hypothetical protein
MKEIGLGRTAIKCLKTKRKKVFSIPLTVKQLNNALQQIGSELRSYGWNEYTGEYILSVDFIENQTIDIDALEAILTET